MKTRIISGVVMALIVAAFLTLGILVSPLFITAFIAAVTAVAVYELLHNAAGIRSKAALIGACAFSVLFVVGADENLQGIIYSFFPYSADTIVPQSTKFYNYWSYGFSGLVILYFIFAAIVILKNHKDFGLAQIAALFGFPLPYAYAFSCLGGIISHMDGIFYLLLLLNFSSVCDMGAYFVGSTIGKHKLCPEISPKKTVEGAVGGILSSVVVTLILVFAFSVTEKLLAALILTVPFCVLGMIGDLFASAIKRTAGIKDYGNLIPGHGGILDRFDSIIMIAPLFSIFVTAGIM